jgi:hypothetical protein
VLGKHLEQSGTTPPLLLGGEDQAFVEERL